MNGEKGTLCSGSDFNGLCRKLINGEQSKVDRAL